MGKSLTIGDLGGATGTKVNTIRFYEQIGLMRPAARTPSGRRVYDDEDLRRLRFIRRARKLGFETDEIRSLLAISDRPEAECASVSEMAHKHLGDIRQKISELKLLHEQIERLAGACSGGQVSRCSILEGIGGPG
jgi:DNA-binding transcriptional MerR regulator